MAHSDKNIVITPNISSTTSDPKIVFSGADASTAAQDITLQVYPTNGGTLSFEGSAGQLLSITNDLTGTIFSVNDISGIPSIEVDDDGTIRLAEFGGNILIGTGTNNSVDKLQIAGAINASGTGGDRGAFLGNLKVGYGSAYNTIETPSSSDTAWIQYNHAGNVGLAYGGGYTTAYGSIRAPIFYDSDNTAYYVNPSASSVFAGDLTNGGDIYAGGGQYHVASGDYRTKYSLWGDNDTNYGMGMGNSYTFGALNDYAITFQMSNTATRGFWWGDTGHTNAQGAMSLTTQGQLVVADSIRVGYGESDTTAPAYDLDISGTGYSATDFRAPIFYDSDNTIYYVNPASTVYSAVFAGNVSIGGIGKTSDTTVAASAGDSNSAGFVAHGNAQGTAYFEWSQNTTRTYGGGVVYNGDGVPSFGAGEVTDRTTFYRIISGSKYKVFDYPYDNSIVTFYDEISVENTCIAKNFDEGINSTTGVSGTSSLSPSGGSIREISLSGNVTFTSGFEYGESMTLMLTGGATYTVTWPTMTWLTPNGNVAPTLNGTKDLIVIWRGAYGNLYGAYAGYGA